MYKLESTTQFKKAYQGWESFKIIQAIEQGAMIQCPLQFVSKTIKNNNMKNIRAFALFLLLTFTENMRVLSHTGAKGRRKNVP